MSRIGRQLLIGVLCLLVASSAAWSSDWTQDKFEIGFSIAESKGDSGSSRDYSWNFDGLWTRHHPTRLFSITVDSDYSKAENGGSEVDRLKTWLRRIYQNRPAEQWNPVVTISTEGDHDCDTVLTLVAGGMRKEFPRGFLELTAGASKDVRSAESWAGDIGALFQYQRQWGRLGLTVNPETSYGMLGEFRLRRKRLRYTFDTSLDYSLGKKLSLTYRLHRNNFKGTSQRHQYLGLTYVNN